MGRVITISAGSRRTKNLTTLRTGAWYSASYLDDEALFWFNETHKQQPFTSFLDLCDRMAKQFGIRDRSEASRFAALQLSDKPWRGPYPSYHTTFSLNAINLGDMDPKTLKILFIKPLSDELKRYVATLRCTTWQQVHEEITKYLMELGQLDLAPLPLPSSTAQHRSSPGPVPMDVGAVPTRSKQPGDWTAAEKAAFFKDKLCPACGQRGHSQNYVACPKHPRHAEWVPRKPGKPKSVHAVQLDQPNPAQPNPAQPNPAQPGPSALKPKVSFAQVASAQTSTAEDLLHDMAAEVHKLAAEVQALKE